MKLIYTNYIFSSNLLESHIEFMFDYKEKELSNFKYMKLEIIFFIHDSEPIVFTITSFYNPIEFLLRKVYSGLDFFLDYYDLKEKNISIIQINLYKT
jgi:hypothetical protein